MKASKFNEVPTRQMRFDATDSPQAPAPAPVILVKLDGKDHVQGSPAHVAALEAKLDAVEGKLKAAQAEVGALKAKADAAPPAPDVDRLVQDELAFRDAMRPLVAKDYQFAGKSREQVRLDAVGAETAAKAKALPEAQREGYLLAMLEQRRDAADKPSHQPVKDPVKQDEAPKRFDPYARYRDAHKASYASGGAK